MLRFTQQMLRFTQQMLLDEVVAWSELQCIGGGNPASFNALSIRNGPYKRMLDFVAYF